jgi:hypothetical protein
VSAECPSRFANLSLHAANSRGLRGTTQLFVYESSADRLAAPYTRGVQIALGADTSTGRIRVVLTNNAEQPRAPFELGIGHVLVWTLRADGARLLTHDTRVLDATPTWVGGVGPSGVLDAVRSSRSQSGIGVNAPILLWDIGAAENTEQARAGATQARLNPIVLDRAGVVVLAGRTTRACEAREQPGMIRAEDPLVSSPQPSLAPASKAPWVVAGVAVLLLGLTYVYGKV